MAPTLAPTRTGTTTDALNLREGPGTQFAVKTVLPIDTRVEILEEQGDWLNVRAGEEEGFVFRVFVKVPQRIAPKGHTSAALNLREGPGTSFAIKTILAPNTEVTILGDEGEWLRVAVVNLEGFVHRSFVLMPGQATVSGFLIHIPELHAQPLVPPVPRVATAGATSAALTAARIWSRYGGLLETLGRAISIDPAAVVAVLATESGGRAPFDSKGRMVIRFENHVFFSRWGQRNADRYNTHFRFGSPSFSGHEYRMEANGDWITCHDNADGEWRAFEFARSIDDDAAKLSISMGLPQIMGFNYRSVGYESVDAMFDAFSQDERAQILGLFDFIQGPNKFSRMISALQQSDFVTFARFYNGAGQEHEYARRMQAIVDGYRSLE